MPTNNSNNQEFINNADGFNLAGGTTKRGITLSGGNVSVVGNNTGSTSFFQALTNFQYVTYQDANGLTAITNIASDYATTTTSGGNSQLSLGSKRYQYFTGTSTHNVILPDATTVAIGHTFIVKNLSTLAITVKTFDGTNIAVIYYDNEIEFKCIDVTTTVGVWDKNNSVNQFDLETVASSFGARNVTYWIPLGNATTTINAFGAAALTLTGTAQTTATIATTSVRTRAKRVDIAVTVAAATAVAGWRAAAALWTTGGNGTNQGGFLFRCRWGNNTGGTVTTNRAFVGMANSTAAPTDAQPSTQTNFFGMGWDAADTNIQFMRNAAATTTKIDLGANFPVPVTNSSAPYDLIMFSPHSTTQIVYYIIRNLDTNAVATGSVTTNLPTATTLLAPRGYMSVGGTSSVIGITLFNLYIESEY